MARHDAVQQIKERLSIVDVVAPYVELHPAGKSMKGKSPFSNEKTPSFFVSPDRGMYYCFSTAQGGDMFTFVQAMEGVDFKGALKILAEKAGVELVPEDPRKKTERDRQYDVLEAATVYFERSLSGMKQAQEYLQQRGVLPQTIAKWRIGYAPGPPQYGWRELKHALEEEEYTVPEMLRAGLIKEADAGKEAYDMFRDRIMFPIFDNAGHVVAFSGRILSRDSDVPKYVNSPETDLFNKSEILYGYDKAKQGIRSMDFCLCVEGQFDVIMAHQAGYTNTVAISGTALTPHHVMLLQRLSNRAVLALDADRAGIAAVKRAAELMLARGMDVKVVRMPDEEDPADLIQKDAAQFKKVVGQATHVIEYLLAVLADQATDERAFKLQVREEILPYVARIPNRIDQEHFEGVIAKRVQTTQEAIHIETQRFIEKIAAQPHSKKVTQQARRSENKDAHNDTSGALRRKEELEKYFAVLVDVLPKEYVPLLVEHLEKVIEQTHAHLTEKYDPADLSGISFQIEQYIDKVPIKQVLDEVVTNLNELNRLLSREKRRVYAEQQKQADMNGDTEAAIDAAKQIAEVQKQEAALMVDLELFGITT